MEYFELLFTSLWMPVSANMLWVKKVDYKNRIISVILMVAAYVITMCNNYSELKVVIFFPLCFLILYLCFGKDWLALILVPGTYILCVFSNQLAGMIASIFNFTNTKSSSAILVACLLSMLIIVLLSLLIRRVFIFYKSSIDFRNSKKAILSTVLILSASACVYLFNGWQLRNLDVDMKTANVYQLLYFGQAIIIVWVFVIVTKGIQSEERAKREEENHRNLMEYTSQIENMYEELRSFKHDYVNILLTLSGYIDNNDMEGLSAYYEETILPTNEKLTQGKYNLHKLSKIQVPAIKGLLSAKFINALNLGVDLFIDIMDDIPSISMNVLDLTRILGIYIDNAVEAALETSTKEVKFNVVLDKNSVTIVLANSFVNKGVSLNDIEKKSYTTKGEGRGIGLSNVNEILLKYHNVSKMTEIKDRYFFQTLIIENK